MVDLLALNTLEGNIMASPLFTGVEIAPENLKRRIKLLPGNRSMPIGLMRGKTPITVDSQDVCELRLDEFDRCWVAVEKFSKSHRECFGELFAVSACYEPLGRVSGNFEKFINMYVQIVDEEEAYAPGFQAESEDRSEWPEAPRKTTAGPKRIETIEWYLETFKGEKIKLTSSVFTVREHAKLKNARLMVHFD